MMKKKMMLAITTLMLLVLLSSCTMIPVGSIESLFRSGTGSAVSGNVQSGSGLSGQDTVTISREEYEKYQQFSEMFTILDAANANFYQENDVSKMVEYATRGLMAGLDDPYSFYYNPEEFAAMWEEDEGNYGKEES